MILTSIIFLCYISTIFVFIIGYTKVKEFKPGKAIPKTSFSILIPFRNEEKNIPFLLQSIQALNYPTNLYEILFVDDNSSDNSIRCIQKSLENSRINFQIINNIRSSNSPKKDAIHTASLASSKEWIITTDADCVLPQNWLINFDSFIQKNHSNLVVAPVNYNVDNSFLHQFQQLDFLSLQASTISGFGINKPFLCNGANLAYRKEIFRKVKGFDNNDSVASGDDIFILEKFLQFDQEKVHYLKSKDAIVTTKPVDLLQELIHQRVRWASKTSNYKLFFGKFIGVVVLFGNALIALFPFFIIFNRMSLATACYFFIVKLFFDYLLLQKISSFYQKKIVFKDYLLSSIIYPCFTVFVFLISTFSTYEWKGRTFKK